MLDIRALMAEKNEYVSQIFRSRVQNIPDTSFKQQLMEKLSVNLPVASKAVDPSTYSSYLGTQNSDLSSLISSYLQDNSNRAAFDPSLLLGLSEIYGGNILSSVDTGSYDTIINAAAMAYNIDPALIKGVIQSESSFRPTAVSSVGVQGLMQLMPDTAAGLGVENPFDPAENIMAGTRYLRQMLDRFGGDMKLALAAYNCGPNKVEALGGAQNYNNISQSVRNYVESVISNSKIFGSGLG